MITYISVDYIDSTRICFTQFDCRGDNQSRNCEQKATAYSGADHLMPAAEEHPARCSPTLLQGHSNSLFIGTLPDHCRTLKTLWNGISSCCKSMTAGLLCCNSILQEAGCCVLWRAAGSAVAGVLTGGCNLQRTSFQDVHLV